MTADFGRVLRDANAAGLRFVVVGGIAASGAPLDLDRIVAGSLVPLATPFAYVDVLPDPAPPLSYAGLAARAEIRRIDGEPAAICSLADLVALKRRAGRARDQQDLEDLETVHGSLPDPPDG